MLIYSISLGADAEPSTDRLALTAEDLLDPSSTRLTDMLSAVSDEKRLIKYLLDSYREVGVIGRPVANISTTIKVNFGLALVQLLNLDEKNQVLTTNMWSRYVRMS